MCLEYSGLDVNSACARSLQEILIERGGISSSGSLVEAGTAAFAAISIECELRDNQQAPTDLHNAAVHLAFLIRKNTQPERLFDQVIGFPGAVAFCHSQQHEQAPADGGNSPAIHRYARLGDTLNDDPHSYAASEDPALQQYMLIRSTEGACR